MIRVVCLFLIGVLLWGHPSAAALENAKLPDAEIARAMGLYYESRLHELTPKFRGHWLLRRYRTSGEQRYLDALHDYAKALREEFAQYAGGIYDPVLRARKIEELLGPPRSSGKGKYGQRRQVLAQVTDYLYMHQLLYLTFMLHTLGESETKKASYQAALEALRGFSFRRYLLDAQLLKYNAAEMANGVYYLDALGLGHFEQEFFTAFQQVHFAGEETEDPVLFENKVYGMTHVVIAASGYYQRFVAPERFQWILDYFEQNADMLLRRLKPDVIAEVGLCFLLTGLPRHPLVAKTRQSIAEAWDPASGMILSVKGSADLNHGEHRNILAVMLLEGFDKLYPGPNLTLRN